MPTPIQRVFAAAIVIIITVVLIGVLRRYGFPNSEFGTAALRREGRRNLEGCIAILSYLFLFMLLSPFIPLDLFGSEFVTVMVVFFMPIGLGFYFVLRGRFTMQALRTSNRAKPAGDSGDSTTGTVIAAKRLPPSSVPRAAPTIVRDDEMLALDVRLESGRQTTVYTPWSTIKAGDSPLGERSVTAAGDLYNEEVSLVRVDEQYLLAEAVPGTPRVGSWWGSAVWVCLLGQTAVWLLNITGVLSIADNVYMGSIFAVTWLLFPIAMYHDVMYVRSTSEWTPNRLIWPILVCIWLLNILVGGLYLYKRSRTTVPEYV